MSLIKKSITITEKQNEWIKSRISFGDYGNDSEYLRDLIRRDKAENQKLIALQQAIQKGIDSGVSERSFDEIIQSVEDKLRNDGKL
ncbi:MAG: type II toxin-antitoxin system ParD family antitoxin [Gammaproteobacteria bacterium]|jgi:antitoxin ParD1/3/4|nr:type II toxin-antitoxin system ParD family antitoxin [Xanthomonadales bacterium]